jgi:hypothetical protein
MSLNKGNNETIAKLQKDIADLQAQLASLNANNTQNIEQANATIISRKINVHNFGRQQDLEDLMKPEKLNLLLDNHKGDVTIIISHKDGTTSFTVYSDGCCEEDYLALYDFANSLKPI